MRKFNILSKITSLLFGVLLFIFAAGTGIPAGNHFLNYLPPVAITTQPVNDTVCTGSTASFQVGPSNPSGLNYQWYRGSTPLSDGGRISGATTGTLQISSAELTDAAGDYYVIISDGSDNTVSDFAELVVNDATAAPSSGVSGLTFTAVGNTSVLGKFNAVADADYYVVFRADAGTSAPDPDDGTLYTEDAEVAIGGNTYFVEYTGPDTTFVSAALNPESDYHYWVFAYNEGFCSPSPVYNHTGADDEATTTSANECGVVDTLYWAGAASTLSHTSGTDFNDFNNWSTNESSYSNTNSEIPTGCTNVIISLSGAVDITLNSSSETGSLILTNTSGSNARLLINGKKLTVNGNALITADATGNISLGENTATSGGMEFRANVIIQRNTGASGTVALLGVSGGTITFRGSVLFGPGSKLDNANTDVVFNGLGQKLVYNNPGYVIKFRNVSIRGNSYLTLRGNKVQDDITGNLTIQNNGVLRLPKGTQWNRSLPGGNFLLSESSKLIIEGNSSVLNSALQPGVSSGGIPEGSNFPAGYLPNLTGESTVIYNSSVDEPLNIFNFAPYANLKIQKVSGVGFSWVSNDGAGFFAANTTVSKDLIQLGGVKWVLSSNLISGAEGGSVYVSPRAAIYIQDKIITISEQFVLEDSAILGVGSSSGLSGNFNLSSGGTLSLDPNATYIYNGTDNQILDSDLPLNANIVIDNSAANGTVSLPSSGHTNYQPNSIKLVKGALNIGDNTLTVNDFSRNSGRFAGSDLSDLVVNNPDLPLYFSQASKKNYLRQLTLNEGGAGYLIQQLSDTLNITGGYNAVGQAGHVKLNENSKLITTGGNLTLRSNIYGTASLSEIEGAGSGMGQIDGPVIVERYINIGTITADPVNQHPKAWHFLATPTEGQSIKNSWMESGNVPDGYGIMLSGPQAGWDVASPAPAIKEYDPVTDTWVGASSADDPLYNENGWMTFIRGDRHVTDPGAPATNTVLRSKGTLKTGERQLNVPAREDGFMAFGNPYASAIDMRQLAAHGNLGNELGYPTFYIWNPNYVGLYGLGAYQAFTYDGTDFISTSDSGNTTNNYLLSGQAFFVQSFDNPYTITIRESDKGETTANKEYFRTGAYNKYLVSEFSTDLYRVGGDIIDGTLQFFSKDFSDDVNLDDGRKMFNSGINLSIKVKNYLLVVERRQPIGAEDTIAFNLSGVTNGTYRFVFKTTNLAAPGLKAWLEDAYTGERTPVDLEGKTEVIFEANADKASKAVDRFRVVFKAEPEEVNLDIDAEEDNRNVDVNWSADDEGGVVNYVLTASADGVNFNKIKEVVADGSRRYTAVDLHPVDGYNHYRVKAVNIYGFESYSDIAKVFVGPREPSLKVFPNPVVNNVIQLHFKNYAAGRYYIRLINPAGQVLLRQEFNHTGGNYTEKVPWPHGQAQGIYRLEVRQPDGSVKIIAIKH